MNKEGRKKANQLVVTSAYPRRSRLTDPPPLLFRSNAADLVIFSLTCFDGFWACMYVRKVLHSGWIHLVARALLEYDESVGDRVAGMKGCGPCTLPAREDVEQ